MARPATGPIGAAPTPSPTYYHTLAEIAAFLRVSRETIHRWLEPRSGLIRCPNGRTLPSLRLGDRRLVAAAAWAAFVALDAPPEVAGRAEVVNPSAPTQRRRGRTRKAVGAAG